MKKRRVFVVVPSLTPTGPIKGATALCNGLVDYIPVTLVPLKKASGEKLIIDPRIEIASLIPNKSWLKKRLLYQKLLQKAGGRYDVVSISFCFSADIFNNFFRKHAIVISSVRGNLIRIYRFNYGKQGLVAALVHYQILKMFDHVVAMSNSMETQLNNYGIFRTVTIGNFIDEPNLETMRFQSTKEEKRLFRFVFLASLTKQKCPDLLINAIHKLHRSGIDCCIDIVGDGPLRSSLEEQVREYGISTRVTFYGNLSNPYRLLQKADYMVLPSETEGISRSVLEALFFGVPCILRDVDANREIIKDNYNGFLFRNDRDILNVMEKAISTSQAKKNTNRNILLPPKFRQKNCMKQYLSLLESLL